MIADRHLQGESSICRRLEKAFSFLFFFFSPSFYLTLDTGGETEIADFYLEVKERGPFSATRVVESHCAIQETPEPHCPSPIPHNVSETT